MNRQQFRDHLIATGVKGLQDFGYPNCATDNILTDRIYKAFFGRMLKDAAEAASGERLSVINELIAETMHTDDKPV